MKTWQKLALGGAGLIGVTMITVSSCMVGYMLGERTLAPSSSPRAAVGAPDAPPPVVTPAIAAETVEPPSPMPQHTPIATPFPTETPTSVPALARQPAVGEDVLVGDVRWRVLTVEQLGNRLTSDNRFIEPATTMGKYVRVRFEVENRGSDSTTYDNVEIVDGWGRSFRRSIGVGHWIPDSEDCFLETLNPNVPKTCNHIFDVAADATGLQLKVGDLKLFGNQEALIALGL